MMTNSNDVSDLVVDQNELKQLIFCLKLRLDFKISFNLNLIKIGQYHLMSKQMKVEITCCSSLPLSSVRGDCAAGCVLVEALDLTCEMEV